MAPSKNLLLSSGTFTDGMEFFSAIAVDNSMNEPKNNYNTDMGNITYNIFNATEQIFRVQLRHDVAIKANKKYTVCFDTVSDSAREIGVDIDSGGSPSFATAVDGPKAVNLTVGAQSHAVTFESTKGHALARMKLNLGGAPAVISVDNVGVFEGEVCGATGTAEDDDKDNVPNEADQCADTPAKELVNNSGCSSSQLDNDNDGIFDDKDLCDNTPTGQSIDNNGCSTSTENDYASRTFTEENGLIVIEMENTNFPTGWIVKYGEYAAGNAYLMWNGENSFREAVLGIIDIKVKINNPGTYRFLWRNIIGVGEEATEHNDSWLKIFSPNFFGYQSENMTTVCPDPKDATNNCISTIATEGAGSNGYFKLYRSGGPVNYWKWHARTSDFDPHEVYAEFPTAGEYDLKVAARSFGHGIDRIVMFRELNAEGNYDINEALDLELPESPREAP